MAKIMTTQGPVSPDEFGVALSHVHLLIDVSCWFTPPTEASRITRSLEPVRMENLGIIRRDAFLIKDNLILGDVELAIQELMDFKRMGGTSIVEVTMPGIGRDAAGLLRISRATGVNVVCGTGWYVAFSHPPYIKEKTIDDLCAIMVKELTEGIGSTGIKAGVIGEIGMYSKTDEPFQPDEEKVLRAAARAQAKTGAALTIHPNYPRRQCDVYLDILEEEGADITKCYLSHMEMYWPYIDYQKSLMNRGVNLSYDQFGSEMYFDSIAPGFGYVSDRERVQGLVQLLKAGFEKQIMLSNEVTMKCGLKHFGGYGYSHVQENIIPELRARKVTDDQLYQMLVENPKRILAF